MLHRELRALQRRGTTVLAVEPGGDLVRVMGVNPMRGGRVDEVEDAAAERAARVLAAHLEADPETPFRRVTGA